MVAAVVVVVLHHCWVSYRCCIHILLYIIPNMVKKKYLKKLTTNLYSALFPIELPELLLMLEFFAFYGFSNITNVKN